MALRVDGRARAFSDEERWQEALRLARELPPVPVTDLPWQRRRVRLRWTVVLGVVVVLVAAVVVGVVSGHGVGTQLTRRQGELGALAGIALVVVGFVQLRVGARRLGAWDATALTPAAVLTASQQRELWRQVRGKAPADPALLPVTLDLAAREAFSAGSACATTGVVVMNASWSLAGDWRAPAALLFSVLLVVGVVRAVIRQQQAMAFVQAHAPVGA